MTWKLFLCKIWMWVLGQHGVLLWFRGCWEGFERFANGRVTSKKKCEKSDVLLLHLQKYLANSFFWVDFLELFPQIWDQRKILWILSTHMQKKNKRKFLGSLSTYMSIYVRISRMRIRRKWLDRLKNFCNNHFWEYYLASFCWWISSSCENHCTLMGSDITRDWDREK